MKVGEDKSKAVRKALVTAYRLARDFDDYKIRDQVRNGLNISVHSLESHIHVSNPLVDGIMEVLQELSHEDIEIEILIDHESW